MKRWAILFSIFFFLLLASSFVIAQIPLESLDKGIDDLEKVKEFTEEDKWNYLAEEWKVVLFRSELIVRLDLFLQKTSPIFFVLTGENYNLSLLFLFSSLLWVLFFFTFGQAFGFFSPFSPFVGWTLALIFAVLMGHAGIYVIFSSILFKIIFFRDGAWQIAGIGFLLVGYAFLFASVKSIFFNMKLKSLMADEELKKKLSDLNRQELQTMMEKLRRGLG